MELTYKVSSQYRFIETPLSQTVNLFLIPQAKNYNHSLQFTTSKKSNQTRNQIKNEKGIINFTRNPSIHEQSHTAKATSRLSIGKPFNAFTDIFTTSKGCQTRIATI